MTWKPASLTRQQMEERRLEGGQWLKAGRLSQAEIARRLGVSRMAVSQWAQQMEAAGLHGLRRRKAPGRRPKLTPAQQGELTRWLKGGAQATGFATARWTLERVQQLIEREFGVRYHPNYLNRLLDQLDWSQQVPLPRATERNEARVQTWLERDWPRIKKGTANRRRNRVF